MHTYEVGPLRRAVRGWARAKRLAQTEAVARDVAVSIWTVTRRGTVRTLTVTVFPDGSVARPPVLHRTPRGFGL
jgi:hypothetical protein